MKTTKVYTKNLMHNVYLCRLFLGDDG